LLLLQQQQCAIDTIKCAAPVCSQQIWPDRAATGVKAWPHA
jgi:hypothetical protein